MKTTNTFIVSGVPGIWVPMQKDEYKVDLVGLAIAIIVVFYVFFIAGVMLAIG